MKGKTEFKMLFSPAHIGKVQIKNRLIKTAAGMHFSGKDSISDKDRVYYEAMAKGGAGLIIIGGYNISYPTGDDQPELLSSHDKTYISSMNELTQIIHKYGCKTFLQLFHSAPWHPPDQVDIQPVCASHLTLDELFKRIPPHTTSREPRELAVHEIKDIIKKFAMLAELAQKAGFDGVDLNFGGCHLINSFLSLAWNRRQDEYGCADLESRSRIAVDIIQETKRLVGKDFPLSVIFNAVEYGIDKCINIEEGKSFARIMEDAGTDLIQVRVCGYGIHSKLQWTEQVFYPEPTAPLIKELDWSHRGAGAFLPVTEELKKVVSIPVMVAGRLDHKIGEEALQQRKLDFVGITRRLIADPELPNKVFEGRLDDIAPCTACNTCSSMVGDNMSARCRINAAIGNEYEYAIKKADKKKRVVVVGGGPGGMEAARVAAERGHEVILFEKDRRLGGLLHLASLVKDLEIEDLPGFIKYFELQLKKLDVKIKLGKKFNPTDIENVRPDVVILALGGVPATLNIKGIDSKHVVTSADLRRKMEFFFKFFGPKALQWLTNLWMPVGKRVVIIGGGIQGCQLAEFLVKRGRKITIVEASENLGEEVPSVNRVYLLEWLDKKGVVMLTGVKFEEIAAEGLVISKNGKRKVLKADTIIPALPLLPNNKIERSIRGKAKEIYSIGDCKQSGLIVDAVSDAWYISRAL